jgi:hypothetical protein
MQTRIVRLLATPVLLLAGGASAAVALGSSAAATPKPPATLTAALITHEPNTVRSGTPVSPANLGQRVFVNSKDGFALGAVGEAQYPAETTNGGASWRTFGPALHENAAQAPLSVTEIGALNKRTVYFFGAGQVVDVTSDGGKQWWRALTQELSLAVVPGFGSRLVWITQETVPNSTTTAVTWPYVTSDGGKVWHYTTALGGGI